MPATSSDLDFLDLARKSGLVSDEAIQKFEQNSPETLGDPTAISAAMIRQGLITTFQSKVLLSGKYRGFILGPYKVLEPIGKGGMGRIFLAEHTSLQRRVAIKVLQAEKSKNQELLQRFYREARAAAALDHPNIVKIFDVNQGAGTHFLVMEYVHGKTLQQIVTARGPIHYQKAIHYIIQTATGLKHAHEKGFIHRDIKPDNIILSTEGVIKILDMGLARSLNQEQDNVTKLMNPNAIYGSVDYISPEQSIGGNVDARSDLYSLGATLFALITGVAPFSGTSAQILVSHQLTEVPNLAKFRASAPPQLNAIVAKMMAKQPNKRYRNASEVIDALLPWLPAEQGSQTLVTSLPAKDPETVRVEVADQTPSETSKQTQVQPAKRKKKVKPRFTITPKAALAVVVTGLSLALLSLSVMFITSKSSSDASKATENKTPPNDKQPANQRNYVSNTPRTDVVDKNCVSLDLRNVVNVISTANLFNEDDRAGYTDTVTLPAWGHTKYYGVPFDLIDPLGKTMPNVLVFQGGDTAHTRARRPNAIIPCHTSAKVIHVLGGISGWAYPHNDQRTVALIAKLRYKNGQIEEHPLLNGTHFADWRQPQAGVPTAPVVAQFDAERHLRYFSIEPKSREEIAEIELTKGPNKTAAPIFFAITVEKP
jgi:serine/threonine protein kinase